MKWGFYLILLFFCPTKLNALAEKFNKKDSINDLDKTNTIRGEIYKSFVWTALILLLARVSSTLLGVNSIILPNDCLIFLSAFILLWATIGLLGGELQTWGAKSFHENLNRAWYKFLYGAGTFLFFLSIFLKK